VKKFFLLNKDFLAITLLLFFAFYFNNSYSNLGVFPIDTFLHFDGGFRLMNGILPFRDYWAVSGLVPDMIEAFFFTVFGANWKIHTLHASLFNSFISISTFFILKKIGLNASISFLYSLFFSIIAYPLSGTPFIDHHAVFFSLLAIYCFILGIDTKKKYYWIFMIFFFVLSFFSKQVPVTYISIFIACLLIYYSFLNKDIGPIKYSAFTLLFFVILVFVLFNIFSINYKDFLTQYIFYPPNIALNRVESLNSFSIFDLLHEHKFIFFPLFILIAINIKKIYENRNYLNERNFYIFCVIFCFSISLIIYQFFTKNQNFIYFLSILLFSILHSEITFKKLKFKNFFSWFLLVSSFLITLKIHFEFNETRKFHELRNVNLENSRDASLIDKKLSNLRWITPLYEDDPDTEINLIKKTLMVLKEDQRNKMIITHYSFFSTLLNDAHHTPSRTHTLDGASFPVQNSNYLNNYKNFFKDKIKKNKINVIYIINNQDIRSAVVKEYLDTNCIVSEKEQNWLQIFELDYNC